MSASDRWSDLAPRILSAVVMIAAGLVAILSGGAVFLVSIALLCAAMLWELARMVALPQNAALALGALGAVVLVVAAQWGGGPLGWLLLLIPGGLMALLAKRERPLAGVFGFLIIFAGAEMLALREGAGLLWLLWLIVIVITSDVAGYFAGRTLGGPKFWPRISPKKTWSGTIAGWLGAAVVGAVFALLTEAGAGLVLYSVLVAFAAQMGDIAESALKRRVGAKDSSALIPGHGGFLDRFDGMIGASFLVFLGGALTGLPPGVF